MRPLEILLLGLLALLSGWLAFGAPGRARFWPLLFLAPVAALIEVLIESARWQMTPAYLAALVPVAALALNFWRRGAVAGAVFGLTALSLGLGLGFPVRPLPAPPGPYAIGTRTYDWADPARPEPFTADPADHREVVAQVWYPVASNAKGPLASYVPQPATLAPLARLLKLPAFALSHLSLIRTNARVEAPAAAGRFPVLVFAHGRGGWRGHNTAQIEALVSRGYVVVAVDHAYGAAGSAFPDGRLISFDPRMMDRRFEDVMIPVFAADARLALDRLTELDRQGPLAGRLDTGRAGMFGLSMGGIITAETCRGDPRFKACLIMDVDLPPKVAAQGLPQPAFYIDRDLATMRKEGWPEAISRLTFDSNQQAFGHNQGPAWKLQITGPFHADFSDMPLLCARIVCRALGLSGPIGKGRTAMIVETYEAAFFDRWLKGGAAPLLDAPPPFPEARLDRR
jgi:predicted dienelactone hydrolase